MALLSLVLINTGCEDKIDTSTVNPSEGKTVEVTLNIGLANEVDGYTLSAPSSTKSNVSAFSYELQSAMATKGTDNSPKPNKLYNLEIQQYDRSGARINGMVSVVKEQELGSALGLTLTPNSDCQLVIVAWGQGNTTTLGTGDLTSAQEISIEATKISGIDPSSQADMNKMPYVLHLEHVCVDNNTIKSIDGEDVRLLLRRLATRLTLSWNYSYSGYKLKQILLQSIPLDYKVVAAPDINDKTYPSLLDQYPTIQLTNTQIAAGTYSCWIPANVRGSSSLATSQTYRIKSNAPTGSSYVDFIAVNTSESKKKLSYRVYLGGPESTDFNLYGNTDYNYTVNINHTGLPVNDRRVTIIDPIAASENNNNIVPTANCFMVAPGGAFCFDPYTYQQNGVSVANATLKGWGNIASVKLLWQTKENGDLGDPVIGVVNSDDDHTNIVELKNNLIYCRVAPNTQGGNGVIAAFDSNKKILWSWHIWVTNYQPDATGNESIDTPVNKRKQKYTYRCADQLPMMDRNLGATAGYIDLPTTELEKSMANGLHYQWGRKDPFPSSYSNRQATEIVVASDKPTKGMLNLYEPDGISFFKRSYSNGTANYSLVYQNPTSFYQNWLSFANSKWQTDNQLKNEHDPCPVGWRVASFENYASFFTLDGYKESTSSSETENIPINIQNGNSAKAEGGALLFYEQKGEGPVTYYRFNGYQRHTDRFMYIGLMTNIWCREMNTKSTSSAYALSVNYGGYPFDDKGGIANNIRSTWSKADAHSVRCIQERK